MSRSVVLVTTILVFIRCLLKVLQDIDVLIFDVFEDSAFNEAVIWAIGKRMLQDDAQFLVTR